MTKSHIAASGPRGPRPGNQLQHHHHLLWGGTREASILLWIRFAESLLYAN